MSTMKKGEAARRERFFQYLNNESHIVRMNSSVHIRRLSDKQLLLIQMGASYRLSLDPEVWVSSKLEEFFGRLRKGDTLQRLCELVPSAESEQERAEVLKQFLVRLFEMKLLHWEDPEAQDFRNELTPEWSFLLSHFLGSDLKMNHGKIRIHGREKSPRLGDMLALEIFELPGLDLVEVGDADLIVVLACEENYDELSRLNQAYLASEQAWVALVEDAFGGILTPVFGRKGDPCFECYRLRIEANSRELGQDLELAPTNHEKSVSLIQRQLAGRVALEVLKKCSGMMDSRLERGALFFDVLNQRTELCEVFPNSSCRVCRGGFALSEPSLYSFLTEDDHESF